MAPRDLPVQVAGFDASKTRLPVAAGGVGAAAGDGGLVVGDVGSCTAGFGAGVGSTTCDAGVVADAAGLLFNSARKTSIIPQASNSVLGSPVK